MAIAYKSAGAGGGTETSSASLDLACPAVVAANDILIAHTAFEGLANAPSTPSGWTLLYGPAGLGTGTAIGRSWVFGKLADGSEDGATIGFGSHANTSGRYGRIYSFDGYVSGTISQICANFTDTASETSIPLPTVTTVVTGSLAVALLVQDDNNSFAAAGAVTGGTWAEPVAEFVSTTLGAQGCIVGIQTSTTTGNPGTITGGTANATADEGSSIGLAISPDAVAPRFVQEATAIAVTTGTGTATFAASTTSGNLLVAVVAGDKNAGTMTASGWTEEQESAGTNVSIYLLWKVSAGEISGTFDWSLDSGSGHSIWIGEYEDPASGTWTMHGKALNADSSSNVNSWSTGTTGSLGGAGIAVGAMAVDSWFSVTGSLAWTRGYRPRFGIAGSGGLSHGYPYISDKLALSGTTEETTFSYSDAAVDQLAGTIAVFGKVGSGQQDITPGATTVTATPGTVSLAMSIAPTGASVAVTPGTAVITQPQAVTPAPVTVTVSPGSLTVTPGAASITPAPVTVAATPGSLSLAMAVIPAPVTVSITPGSLTVIPNQAITPAPVTVTATPGSLTVVLGQSIVPAPLTVTATPGTLSLAMAVTPAPVTVTVTPGSLTVSQPATQNITLYADPTLYDDDFENDFTGSTVTITAGSLLVAVTQPITPAVLTVSVTPGSLVITPPSQAITPAPVTVSVTPGSVTVIRNQAITPTALIVTVTAGTLTVVPGPASITPQALTVTITAGSLSVVGGVSTDVADSRVSTGHQTSRGSTGDEHFRVSTGRQGSRAATGDEHFRVSSGHQTSRIVSSQEG